MNTAVDLTKFVSKQDAAELMGLSPIRFWNIFKEAFDPASGTSVIAGVMINTIEPVPNRRLYNADDIKAAAQARLSAKGEKVALQEAAKAEKETAKQVKAQERAQGKVAREAAKEAKAAAKVEAQQLRQQKLADAATAKAAKLAEKQAQQAAKNAAKNGANAADSNDDGVDPAPEGTGNANDQFDGMGAAEIRNRAKELGVTSTGPIAAVKQAILDKEQATPSLSDLLNS